MNTKAFDRRVSQPESCEACIERLLQRVDRFAQQLDELVGLLSGAAKPYLTVDEVASLVGRQPYTVRRWITEQRIKATRISGTGPRGKLLIPREQVQQLIAQGLASNVPPAHVLLATRQSASGEEWAG